VSRGDVSIQTEQTTHRQIALRIVQEWRAGRQCYVHLDYEALVNTIEAVLDAKTLDYEALVNAIEAVLDAKKATEEGASR
jgi:hypothetical protein